MVSKSFAVVAVVLLFAVFAVILVLADDTRARRPVAFNGTVELLGMIAPNFRIPLVDVEGIEVVGCALTLAGVRADAPSGEAIHVDPSATLEPYPKQHLYLKVEGGKNLDAKGKPSRIDIEPIAGSIHGSGVEWTFTDERTVNLFAKSVTVDDVPSAHWEHVTFGKQPPSAVRLSTPSSLLLKCSPGEGGVRAALGLILRTKPDAAASPNVDFEMQMLPTAPRGNVAATSLELRAPKGAVAIGTQTTVLGAGNLTVMGDATIERVRWIPAMRPVIDVSAAALSSDVQLGGEQLVPSTLAEWAHSPAWTTFAAVIVVALSAWFSKLFDHVWPTPKD
jgi:hypothetical protein